MCGDETQTVDLPCLCNFSRISLSLMPAAAAPAAGRVLLLLLHLLLVVVTDMLGSRVWVCVELLLTIPILPRTDPTRDTTRGS